MDLPPVLTEHELPAWATDEVDLAEAFDAERVAAAPFYETPAGAGQGGNAGLAQVRSFMMLDRDWLRREARVDPDRAFVVQVYGHSMEGKLDDGDLVLCEYRQDPIDGIMAVLHEEHMYIKHVVARRDSLVLVSNSAHYPDIEVSEHDHFQVMGRAVRKVVRI